jgi:HEAT repeat protein
MLFSFDSPAERLELMRLLQQAGQEGISALPLLKEALGHEDQDVRRAAMRGLAATQSQEAIALLKEYLSDEMAIEESTEAALALATMNSPEITPLLERSLEGSSEPVLREHIVDALVSRPAFEVAAFIDSFLARTDVPVEEKQNLLRMTGLNNTRPSEFLAAYLQSPDESLRLGSYQGLALVSESRQTQFLMPKVALEPDPFNRSLVYEALGNQLDASPVALAALADSEKDDYAQLRALKAWTESASRQNLPLAVDSGSAARITKLQEAALSHPDFAERRVALFALGFARNDPAARGAIGRIAQDSGSEKIRALARGLLSNPH